ncbi:malonate decarboxylase holo-ACP synthase [Acinetobacter bereziniae]|uniref:malonate decarboxylase holo-ACP synthase n=1 Tax=Acinetobacter bereziniae TaxID=106648 RepID=UPI001250A6CD|nr:malonate decarboxylase holo-ACP synthase [Acinetobacter bereziniae]
MQPQAHDLLWGLTEQCLPLDVPEWVNHAIQRGDPVVVRRAVSGQGMIPVGVRGTQKSQRYALMMPEQRIEKCIKPEQLCALGVSQFPQWARKILHLQTQMNSLLLQWGYTGSMGFELATGRKTVTAQSDLDVLIRTPKGLSKAQAFEIWQQLQQTGLPLDVQLQTPLGGVALKEWVRATGKVLLKRNQGAVLVNNPWQG